MNDPDPMELEEELARGTYLSEASEGISNLLTVGPDGTSNYGQNNDPDRGNYEPVVQDKKQDTDLVKTFLNRGQRSFVLRGLQRAKEVYVLFQEALGSARWRSSTPWLGASGDLCG